MELDEAAKVMTVTLDLRSLKLVFRGELLIRWSRVTFKSKGQRLGALSRKPSNSVSTAVLESISQSVWRTWVNNLVILLCIWLLIINLLFDL